IRNFSFKKPDKTIDENFKEETQNTPNYSNVLFITNRLGSPEKSCIISFGPAQGQSPPLSRSIPFTEPHHWYRCLMIPPAGNKQDSNESCLW
uniref:Uncharacterized protein n=1 Tax=Moschus moschiferus TaxID=68415 RepID=A0A8C6FQX9_MOSMO